MLSLLVPLSNPVSSLPFRFDVVNSELVVDGYQLYAVEKWVVDRGRPIVTLAVYTGKPAHRITVSALSPSFSFSPQAAATEWDRALQWLRKDGARPRDTPHGVLMTTSLADFRSDFTIVHIPTGNFRDVKHQLYTNINLLRMGSSGRSALCLDEPSDTTKDRFLSVYHIPEPISTSLSPTTILTTPSKPKSHKKSKSLDPSKLRQYTVDTHRYFPEHPLVSPPASVPDSHRAVSNTLFGDTVIELVRIIQAALSIFGLFPSPPPRSNPNPNIDGLLCDNTVDSIQRWITEIGGPLLGIEPMERVLDPTVVSALLSLVLCIRNKLALIGYAHVVPKDPFLHPHTLTSALAAYIHTSPHATHALPHQPQTHGPHSLPHASSSSFASASTSQVGNMTLTHPIIQAVNRAYDRVRHTEARRVHRVIRGKFDDFRLGGNSDGDVGELDSGLGNIGSGTDGTAQILGGIGSLASGLGLGLTGGSGGTSGAGAVLDVIMDLGVFARLVAGHGTRTHGKGWDGEVEWDERKKDSSGRDKDRDVGAVGVSLRSLWSGKIETLVRMRERERVELVSESHEKERRGQIDRDREQLALSDGDAEETRERSGAETRLGEDESEAVTANPRLWSSKVQRKIEAWAGLSRKKQIVDLGTGSPSKGNTMSNEAQMSPTLPAITPKHRDGDPGEEEELLSSGQVSPITELKTNVRKILSEGSVGPALGSSPGNSAFNLAASSSSEYERRVSVFNQKRPWGKNIYQSRVSSWADPLSAQEIVEEEDEKYVDVSSRTSQPPRAKFLSLLDVTEEVSEAEAEKVRRDPLMKRRHSFHDLESFQDVQTMRPDHMQIDVELCAQYLIMSRRAPHLRSVLACLQFLTTMLSETNASLHEDYHTHLTALAEVESRTKVMAEIDAQRLHADVTTQETNTLLYESALFDLRTLWHTASPPRRKVLALREKSFGTGGRRLPRGVHGAHGRFNRLQWTLDERERLVDWLGRTESEEEEEEEVEVARVEALSEEEEEEDVVEHTAIKPVWLLRFFETWGVRWGSTKQEDDKGRNGTLTAPTATTSSKQPQD